ncbi:MAG: translation elongation factor Ts [Anaerolineae bacterium]|nr:MAG: translation elongation factor Ts [Anaerolineae bacterium]
MVKELRQATGAGVLDCKKALEASGGDFDKAAEFLREKGLAAAAKRAGRTASDGVIGVYVHHGKRVAAMVELNCETDFAAGTEEFQSLAHDLAMQVVATQPQYLIREDVPSQMIETEKQIYRAQMEGQGKPAHILDRIVEGKLEKFYRDVCLMEQPFIKEEDLTVENLIKNAVARIGENIVLRRFVRYQIGD